MKKKQFLVIGLKREKLVEPVTLKIECLSREESIRIAKEETENSNTYEWFSQKLNKIRQITKKDIAIKELVNATFSEEQLIKTIDMYEDMLLKGVNFKTLGDIFAPYLIMYDPDIDEFLISKTITRQKIRSEGKLAGEIMEIGFRFLPRKKEPFNNSDHNYHLWYQIENASNNSDFKLLLKQNSNKKLKQWTFSEFIIEMTKIIPDVPIRLEKVVIANL